MEDVGRLKAEMAAAHPDKGGTNEEFNVAKKKYDRAEWLRKKIDEINQHFDEADAAQSTADGHQIAAGLKLLTLKLNHEKSELGRTVKWWDWYADNFTRSQRQAQRVMALACAADPWEAAKELRAKNAEDNRRRREKVAVANRRQAERDKLEAERAKLAEAERASREARQAGGVGEEVDPDFNEANQAAFLLRADAAAKYAVYTGPVNEDVIAATNTVLIAWKALMGAQMKSFKGKMKAGG